MMKNNFFQIPFEQKNITETENGVKIRGLASTRNLDRYGDSVEPTAFTKTLQTFMKNPVMLLQHNHNKPIGRFLSVEVVEDWLEVMGEILYNEDDVISKVKSWVMQAFSIGYIPKKWEIKNSDGIIIRTDEGFQNGFSHEALYNNKNIRTIKELDLVEISIVSVPANAYSTFWLNASTKSFFDNMEKEWEEELKKLEENVTENTENITQMDTNIPPSGDELVDTDNVANEVLKENQENSEVENTEEEKTENSEKSIEVEAKNLETIQNHEKITESSEYKALLQQSEEYRQIAQNLVVELEARNKEIQELKNILEKIPVRKGLVNMGNSLAQKPKQKSFIERLIDEANNS